MLYDVDGMKGSWFMPGDLLNPSPEDLELFRREVNSRAEYGDFYEKFGLGEWEVVHPLDSKSAKAILQEMGVALKEKNIEYGDITVVSGGAVRDFNNEAGGGGILKRKIESASLKFGALRGTELAGFISGYDDEKGVALHSLFVAERFRRKGIARTMLETIIDRAGERDEGVDLLDMLPASERVLNALDRDRPDLQCKCEYYETEGYGTIHFRD